MHAVARRAIALALILPVLGSVAASPTAVAAAGTVTFATVEWEYQPERTAHDDFVTGDGVALGGSGGPSSIHVGAWRSGGGNLSVDLSAPTGATLAIGSYSGALASPTPDHPGISVTVGSQGCSATGGEFEILEGPVFDGASVVSLAVRFQAVCGSLRRAGMFALNASAPIAAVTATPIDTLNLPAGFVGVAGTPVPIHLANPGTADARVTTVELAGPNPGSFVVDEPCPIVAAGATCDLGITFRPTDGGPQQATLRLTSPQWMLPREFGLYGSATYLPATNDTPGEAIAIDALPFLHAGDVDGLSSVAGYCGGGYAGLWYRYTSSSLRIVELDTSGSNTTTNLALLRGSATSPASVACGEEHIDGEHLRFTAEPGVPYWINVQRDDRWGGTGLALRAVEGPADEVVQVGSFSVGPSPFYPYPDDYRDATTIRGDRLEKASVAISIYASTGKKVRTLSVAAGTGPYAVAWKGTDSDGHRVPAGEYRVVQAVTDLWGNVASDERTVRVSGKRLYRHTFTTTIHGADYANSGDWGSGSISKRGSAYASGVRLASGHDGSAVVAYRAKVPAASVYLSVKFQVLGQGQVPPGSIGIQDWTRCAAFDTGCVDPWDGGPISYGWATVKGSGSGHVSGDRVARGYAAVASYGGTAIRLDVDDVRLVVVYGILK